jgi:hypothetical protein
VSQEFDHWSLGGPNSAQPIEIRMVLVDEQGNPYEVAWRPPLPRHPLFLRSVSVLDAVGQPIITVPFFNPNDEHEDECEGAPAT